jgi:hypothetical protein
MSSCLAVVEHMHADHRTCEFKRYRMAPCVGSIKFHVFCVVVIQSQHTWHLFVIREALFGLGHHVGEMASLIKARLAKPCGRHPD